MALGGLGLKLSRSGGALCGAWRAAASRSRSRIGAATPEQREGSRSSAHRLLSPVAAWYVTDILRDAPAPRQRQGRTHRLQDRDLLRLPRCLGGRLRRTPHHRRLGGPARWRRDARAGRAHRRGADPVRCLRAPVGTPRAAAVGADRRAAGRGRRPAAAAEAVPLRDRRQRIGPLPGAAGADRLPARSIRDRGRRWRCGHRWS